jgi:hypothetical protein
MALKSEKDLLQKLTKSDERVAELEKSLSKVTAVLEKALLRPERKAVTAKDVAGLTKSEPVKVDPTKLKPAELRSKLNELAKNPSLTKSERHLINAYFDARVKAADLSALFDK